MTRFTASRPVARPQQVGVRIPARVGQAGDAIGTFASAECGSSGLILVTMTTAGARTYLDVETLDAAQAIGSVVGPLTSDGPLVWNNSTVNDSTGA